ncbi:MAG: ribonuclease R [Cyclobacteriaceae bacterium]|nr:ribonuclease R [Cyclobacteriaceae bacterium]
MSKKKKQERRTKGSKVNNNQLKDKILQLLNSNSSKAHNTKQVVKRLGFRQKGVNKEIPMMLSSLLKEGKIDLLPNGAYKSNREPITLTGKVDHVSSRFAYIIIDGEQSDVYVKGEDLLYAMNGDKVEIAIHSEEKHGKKPEGRVTKILERSTKEIVGRIEFSPRFAFVIPDNKRIHEDVFINLDNISGAAHNDKVLVTLTRWPGHDKSPEGKVTRVLGKAGENDAEIHSIMAEFDLPFEFPEGVEKEAEQISDVISKEEIKRRRDFRKVTTFTIDPEDAKDFDDAISIEKLKNGNFEIGVHIADVTQYVQYKTRLEKEAFHRATSVYLVDRTIPMLPEKLSNGLCSLRPNEDKLTFAAVFEMDKEGNVKKEWFGRTVIHSDRRFTYEDAQERLETKEGDFAEELNLLNALAYKLRAQKFKNGAIAFETTEVRFKLDEKGKPIAVIPKQRKDAHKLVEDFMLLANRSVATYIFKMETGNKDRNTFVYRTHDLPNPEKIGAFSEFAKRFGHKLSTDEDNVSQSLNSLMDEIEGKPEQNVLQSLAIRSMAKAKYTTEANGHFGLAFSHYTHFTSPIRRYPDMMVHRLLQHYLDGGKSVEKEEYDEKCLHSSEREKRASEAERASIKYKQVEFMKYAEDKPYDGVITGVTEWGIFVEITETKCEGMVRMVELKDDYYEFDEDNYRIIGKRNKKIYTLGDKVVVRVTKTDIDRRTIDLEFTSFDEF